MMKMTNNSAISIVNILAGIKLNRIADKDVRASLVWNYVELRRIAKAADERRAELGKKFQEDWSGEINEVLALRSENKPIVGHDKYLESEKAANEMVNAIFNEEVEAKLRPVKMDEFVGAISEEDITFEQVAFLADNGIVE